MRNHVKIALENPITDKRKILGLVPNLNCEMDEAEPVPRPPKSSMVEP